MVSQLVTLYTVPIIFLTMDSLVNRRTGIREPDVRTRKREQEPGESILTR